VLAGHRPMIKKGGYSGSERITKIITMHNTVNISTGEY
jgi:hypothetical protein